MRPHAAAGDGSMDKAMEKCLEEMKKALNCTTVDAEREKRSMLNLLDHCVRNTGLLERTTPWPFSVVVLQHLAPELLISEHTNSLFSPLCHICTVCMVSVLQLQSSNDVHSAHSDLMHTFCDELLATIALCVQSVRGQVGAAHSGFSAVPFGLLHATWSGIKGSESWPRSPSQGSSNSGHFICEIDFTATCGSSLLGWLLQVLHHSLLLYGDALQPFMRTVAQLLPLCLPLCPVQQLPVLLSSLAVLFRSYTALHSILMPSLPGILDVCMLILSDGSTAGMAHISEQATPAQNASLVSATCACMHMLLSLGAHTHQILPPLWQMVQAAASALPQQHQPSALHLFHRLLLMCDTPQDALSQLDSLSDAALRALEKSCTPLQLVVRRTSLKQNNQITKVGQSRSLKRAKLECNTNSDPLQHAGATGATNDIGRRVSRLQRSAAVLACFCSMVHAPEEQSTQLKEMLDEWTSLATSQSREATPEQLATSIWSCARSALATCQILVQERRCYPRCVRTVMQACGKTAACTQKLLQSTSGGTSGGSTAHSACFQQLAVAGCSFSLLYCLLASAAEGMSDMPATGGSTVRTADFADVLKVEGGYRRAMELILRFDIALSLVQRRLDSRMLNSFLEDLSQPNDPTEGTELSEHAFLCTLLLSCPSEPASLALPLSVLRTLLSSLATPDTTPSSTPTTPAIIPPACVQLLVARATARQRALPTARAIAEKMCTWRCSWGENESLPPACVFYVAGTVALYMHADGADKSALAGSSLRPVVDVVKHHGSPQWAPLLSCFAALEQMTPARCIVNYPHRQTTATTIDLVRCMSRGCSGDAVRSFAAVAVAAWWLLESSARPHVAAMLLARLCEEDARITAAMADALQVIHGISDSPLEQLLVAQPSTLRQISSQLIKRPNVLQAVAGALRIDHRWLTERVAEASIGYMCTQRDKAGLHALAEALQTPCNHMLVRCLPLTASICLWEGFTGDEVPAADFTSFLQQSLAETGAGSMQASLRASTTLQCTKMELVYYAAESMQWEAGAPQQWQKVMSCLQMLHALAAGRGRGVAATIREMITVETAEFFLQLMGESLEEHSSSVLVTKGSRAERAPASDPCQSPTGKRLRKGGASGSNADKQPVTRTKPRQPLASARTVVLLLWVMNAEACVHALHFISVLSLCMHEAFVGEVRVLAIQGMQKLVNTLHNHAPKMLRQVAAQIVGHLLAVLQGNVMGPQTGTTPSGPALQCLLDDEKAAATTLLHELVVNMQGVMQGDEEMGVENAIAGFPPIPEDVDIPELRMVRSVLKQVQAGRNFESTVTHLAHSLQQQATQVRHAALGVLSGQLAAFPKATEELFSQKQPCIPACRIVPDDDAQTDALPARLVNALLKCCDLARMPRRGVVMNTMFQRCASCLGQLGALHPARISLPQPGPPSLSQMPFDFLCSAMSHILRILRTAQHLMLVELCIYVLHKLMCHPVAGSREAVLQQLSQSDRELAELHSRDVDLGLRSVPTAPAAPGGIIQPQLSLHRWLHRWLRQMLEHFPQGDMLSMLDVLRAAQSYDITLMLFLLPHVLLGVIISQPAASNTKDARKQGSKAPPNLVHEAIVQEVLAVARLCSTGCSLDDATAASSQPQAALHLQAFLGALDALQRWLHDSKEKLALSKSSEPGVEQLRLQVGQMAEFCNLLYTKKDPGNGGASVLEMLAFASFRSGAAARALMLYEMWLRHAKHNKLKNTARSSAGTPFSHDQVSNLMHIYSSLNDAEALLGVAALRQSGPTNADWIFAARKVGRWNDVESLYELESRAAEAVPDSAASLRQASSLLCATGRESEAELSRNCVVPSLTTSAAEDFLRCLMLAGKYQTLLAVADSWVSGAKGGSEAMVAGAAGIAASWRLGNWAAVDRFVKVLDLSDERLSDQSRWEVAVGRTLLLCHTDQTDSALAEVNEERTLLATLLGPACLESYERAHPLIVKMHMLCDLQTVGCEGLALDGKGNKLRPIDKTRESLVRAIGRAESTGVGMEAHVEMLSLLRALARLHGFQDIVASTWKRQAKVCFASQHAQAAWAGVLEAECAGCKDVFKLKGKLLWQAARHVEAVDVLNCGISALEASPGTNTDPGKTLARARLQLLSWQVSQGQGATDALKKEFNELLKLRQKDDKIHLEFANFLRTVYEDLRMRQLSEAGLSPGNSAPERVAAPLSAANNVKAQKLAAAQSLYLEFAPLIIREYSQVVLHGRKRVQHALPRLLTLLIEFGHDAHRISQQQQTQHADPTSLMMFNRLRNSVQQQSQIVRPFNSTQGLNSLHVHNEVHQTFEKCSKTLPAGKLLPCLSQAVSSLAHPYTNTKQQIQNFVAGVTSKYPSRGLWLLRAVIMSDNKGRRASADAVMCQVQKDASADLRALIKSHNEVCQGMEEVINWDPRTHKGQTSKGKANVYNLKSISRALANMYGSLTMVPTQVAFEAANTAASHATESDLDAAVTVHAVEKEVMVMQSASHPKRIQIIGSDGARYRFLAKPQDDLRRDLRVMEFALLLNRLLEEDASTRGRSMQLQTFMCTPLGDQGGLVEWVLNTQTFQGVLRTTYAVHHYNLENINPGIHKAGWESAYRLTHAEKSQEPRALCKWMEQRLASVPAILHKWWLARMPDPALWLQARATFMRTTAAWSMAGHIVGLGDRHCDNLLIDVQRGTNVQIDFGHLFDSARDLPYPEVMAFRLSQNMVDSFGVYGVEGGFRTTCCAVLRVLRNNQQVIMGLLQAIVNDPFIEWTNSKAAGGAKTGRGKPKAPTVAEDAAKMQAVAAMASVQGKLQGVIAGGKLTPCRQMTVAAQVDFLLNECQDIDNLSRMYIGWLPFL